MCYQGNKRNCQNISKKVVEKVAKGQTACESKGVIKQVGFPLRLCPRMRLLLTGDFLKPPLSGSFGPYAGINQGFTRPSSDTLTTSQTSSRQKTKCTAGITSSGHRLFPFLRKSLLPTILQLQKEEKSLINGSTRRRNLC